MYEPGVTTAPHSTRMQSRGMRQAAEQASNCSLASVSTSGCVEYNVRFVPFHQIQKAAAAVASTHRSRCAID